MVLLVTLGLSLRLGLGGSQGTLDMDWWKSWIVYAYEESLISLYGSDDDAVVADIKAGRTFEEIRQAHAREVRSNRQRFWVAQPPPYVYSLMAVGGIYRLASGGLEDTRWFNFCVNLLNLFSAAATSYLIYRFLRRVGRAEGSDSGALVGHVRPADLALPTALAYWLNPLVLLNAPVQGFLDQLCSVWLVASMMMLYERRLLWAYSLFAVSLLMKPTGLMVLPVLLVVGFKEHSPLENFKGWARGLLIALLSWAPFVIGGHALSVPLGLARLGLQLDVVCRKAINLWYAAQYFVLDGLGAPWWSQVSNSLFAEWTGVRPDRVGTLLFLLFTAINVGSLLGSLSRDRLTLFSAAGLQMLASYAFRTGQHVNHYFLAIPLLAVVALTSRARLVAFAFSCFLFFTADVIFYGFGRDTEPLSELLQQADLQGLTVFLALASLGALLMSVAAAYPRAELWRTLRAWFAAKPARLAAGLGGLVVFLLASVALARAPKDRLHAAASYYYNNGRPVTGTRGRRLLDRVEFRKAQYEEVDGMAIITTSGDPQMLFSARPRRRSCAYMLRLEITPPEQTVLQFFTLPDREEGFSDNSSRELLLAPGRNEVIIALTRQELRSRMRLDPGSAAGRYVIDHLSLRSVRRGCSKVMEELGPKRAVARPL